MGVRLSLRLTCRLQLSKVRERMIREYARHSCIHSILSDAWLVMAVRYHWACTIILCQSVGEGRCCGETDEVSSLSLGVTLRTILPEHRARSINKRSCIVCGGTFRSTTRRGLSATYAKFSRWPETMRPCLLFSVHFLSLIGLFEGNADLMIMTCIEFRYRGVSIGYYWVFLSLACKYLY